MPGVSNSSISNHFDASATEDVVLMKAKQHTAAVLASTHCASYTA
jgi:hypothetical protein